MYPDIIAIGIPFMIACVAIEFLYDLRQPHRAYRLNAAISNISCGIFEQLTGFISKGLFLVLYLALYEHARLTTLQDSLWVFVALVVLVDLVFYFFHRLSHRCSFLWAGHVVHHEVEEFNLTVALRRSVMQEFTIISVYLPFAVLGFSPGAFFLVFAAHNLYQFLIHTSYLPQMKVLGWVLNTPYHHEVHHCRNACYIDKNFGGIFIVWDKLFGTFAARTEPLEFGIGQETTTFNPVKAQITTLMRVVHEARRRVGWRAKLAAVFGPPNYMDMKLPQGVTVRPKYDPRIDAAGLRWALRLFLVLLLLGSIYRNYEDSLSDAAKWGALALVVVGLFQIGRLLDNGRRGGLLGRSLTLGPSPGGRGKLIAPLPPGEGLG